MTNEWALMNRLLVFLFSRATFKRGPPRILWEKGNKDVYLLGKTNKEYRFQGIGKFGEWGTMKIFFFFFFILAEGNKINFKTS